MVFPGSALALAIVLERKKQDDSANCLLATSYCELPTEGAVKTLKNVIAKKILTNFLDFSFFSLT
jgi:hypothetical protein